MRALGFNVDRSMDTIAVLTVARETIDKMSCCFAITVGRLALEWSRPASSGTTDPSVS